MGEEPKKLEEEEEREVVEKGEIDKIFKKYISINTISPYINKGRNLSNYHVSKDIFRPSIFSIGYKGYNLNITEFKLKKEAEYYSFIKIGLARQIYYANLPVNEKACLILSCGISYFNWAVDEKGDRISDFGVYGNMILNYPIPTFKHLFLSLQLNFDAVWLLNKEIGNTFEIFTIGIGIAYSN